MARSQVLIALERQYAIALGKYQTAELATETIVGLAALEEADRRITAEKKILREKMERIASSIRHQVDPGWQPGHIRPKHLKRTYKPQGSISKAAYKVLRNAKGPLKVHEIAHQVASGLGVDNDDSQQIDRLAAAIYNALQGRLKDDMVEHDNGSPRHWWIKKPQWKDSGFGALPDTPAVSA